MNAMRRLFGLAVLLVAAACSESGDLPTSVPDVAEDVQVPLNIPYARYVESPPVEVPAGMMAVHTPFIRIAGVGCNCGNNAANQIIANGDIHGSIERITVAEFNAMSVQDLIDNYDVLIITWISSGLNTDWSTRIEPFLAAGRGVVWEDPASMGGLSDIITTGGIAWGSWGLIPFPGLTEGITADFVNNHIVMASWAPWLSPFITLGGSVVGLAGVAPNGGHLMVTGPDQDFHAWRNGWGASGNQYNLLINQILWLGEPAHPSTPEPTVSPVVTGDLGEGGWYVGDVDVDWDIDLMGGTATTPACAHGDVDADTEGTTFTCTVTTEGGTATASVTIMRDVTPPVVDYAGNAGSYDIAADVAITCSASDPTPGSGMAGDTCADIAGPAYSFGLAISSFSAEGTDNAGNVGTGSTSFTVTASFSGLCTLVESFVSQKGVANSLCAKLAAAERAEARGQTNAQNGSLGAFINEVTAQTGKKIDASDAAILLAMANALMG